MIYGIVGKLYTLSNAHQPLTMGDEIICGNGKTATMVYYLREVRTLQDREIITNFWTTFSTYMSAQEIFEGFFDRQYVTYGISEIQKFLNSIGNQKTKVWIEGLVAQRRKLHIDIFWDSQRWMSVDNRLREHTMNGGRIYVPRKYHCEDGSECKEEDCQEKHYIKVFVDKPLGIIDPVAIFDCEEIGRLYDTDEIIRDNLVVPT